MSSTASLLLVEADEVYSGSDNTTSGILGHLVIGREWISDITPLFFSSTTKDTVSSIYDPSTGISGTPVSVNGPIIYSFTDLPPDLVNDTVPATTTDLIVAPKYDLILWEDAPMCTVSERWFITRDIIALPVYEIAVWPWVLPNSAPVWKGLHLGSWTTWLDPAPLPAENTSGPWAKNVAGQLSAVTRCLRQRSNSAIGTWSISRALTLVFGLGLYLLVVGIMLWSTLATSWYNTGLGNGVSLAALEVAQFGLNYFSVSAIVVFHLNHTHIFVVRSPSIPQFILNTVHPSSRYRLSKKTTVTPGKRFSNSILTCRKRHTSRTLKRTCLISRTKNSSTRCSS